MNRIALIAFCGWACLARAAPAEVIENLNQPVPQQLQFTNQNGEAVQLSRYFRPGRPVVITPVYFTCPVLCSIVLKGVVEMLKQTGLQLGEDYELVTYSIDPAETPAQARGRRNELIAELGYPVDTPAWDFLVGDAA